MFRHLKILEAWLGLSLIVGGDTYSDGNDNTAKNNPRLQSVISRIIPFCLGDDWHK